MPAPKVSIFATLLKNPFPRRLDNSTVIVDEICFCGCKRSEHSNTLQFGHGACDGCLDCQRFTWKAMLVLGQARKSRAKKSKRQS